MSGIKNILKVYDLVDSIDRREGMAAYQRYHDSLYALAKHHGFGFCQTVAAFVALSPNNDYVGNLRSTVSLLEGIKRGNEPHQITVSTYKACLHRAYLFVTGEQDFLMTTKGPKTRAFYHNILNPHDRRHVTIDGHMYGVWHFKRFRMVEVAHLKIPYTVIENDFKTVARKINVIPNQLQAMLWFAWKRHNNVVYSPQASLFNHVNDDIWGLDVDPTTIRGF